MAKKEELQGFLTELNIKDNCVDIIDNAIGTLMLDPVATKNLVEKIANMPTLIREAIYWNKFYMFVTGVREIEEDLGQSVKLSSKLFGDPKNKRQNGMRLLGYVDKADSEQKINYYINATRSLLMGCINNTDYFRIMKAVSETLNEDLEYLREVAITSNIIKGNMQILALNRSGLVLQAGIDANESIETQGYTVSSLGRMVDCFAISLEDEERQKYYEKDVIQQNLAVDLPTTSAEDIRKLFEK